MNKTPEQILKETMDGDDLYTAFLNWHPSWLMKKSLLAIEIAQKEAYNQAIKDAAENATTCINAEHTSIRVDKDSILKLLKP